MGVTFWGKHTAVEAGNTYLEDIDCPAVNANGTFWVDLYSAEPDHVIEFQSITFAGSPSTYPGDFSGSIVWRLVDKDGNVMYPRTGSASIPTTEEAFSETIRACDNFTIQFKSTASDETESIIISSLKQKRYKVL